MDPVTPSVPPTPPSLIEVVGMQTARIEAATNEIVRQVQFRRLSPGMLPHQIEVPYAIVLEVAAKIILADLKKGG